MQLAEDDVPLWSYIEPGSATFQQAMAAVIGLAGVLAGIIYYASRSILWTLVVLAAIITYGIARSTKDLRQGFMLLIFRDRIHLRTTQGERIVYLCEIRKLVDLHDFGYRLDLRNGQSIELPVSGRHYFKGYSVLYSMRPELFDHKPSEH